MKSYQQKIEGYLECNGWEVVSVDSDHNDWWADEYWKLKSTWSPLSSECYLTFLVDPQFEGDRKPREGVWSVGVTPKKPLDSRQAQEYACIVFNKKFKENIETFINQLDEIRTISQNT